MTPAERAAEERYPDDPRNPLSARAAERAAYLVGRKDEAEQARSVVDREAAVRELRRGFANSHHAPSDMRIEDAFDRLASSGILRDAAEVWGEGYDRGFYDREQLPGDSRDASEGASGNPYRGRNR